MQHDGTTDIAGLCLDHAHRRARQARIAAKRAEWRRNRAPLRRFPQTPNEFTERLELAALRSALHAPGDRRSRERAARAETAALRASLARPPLRSMPGRLAAEGIAAVLAALALPFGWH